MDNHKKPSRRHGWDATTITRINIVVTIINVSLVVFQLVWWLPR